MIGSNIVPTKSNLLHLQKQLKFAEEGHQLLEQKRQVLTGEALGLTGTAELLREKAQEALNAAYLALRQANLVMGREAVERTSYASTTKTRLRIKETSVMGVVLPVVEEYITDNSMDYSLFGTCAALDEARNAFKETLMAVAEMAEIYNSLSRLAEEAHKTQIRVNALENIFIPRYSHMVHFIEETLEEREREEMYSRKLGKRKLEDSQDQG
jgi:V/A-type H+-transporting ATPase subunit D